jgi:hypothetical protein
MWLSAGVSRSDYAVVYRQRAFFIHILGQCRYELCARSGFTIMWLARSLAYRASRTVLRQSSDIAYSFIPS